MQRIAIVTDSGSDLSKAQQDRYGITVVPLVVRFGPETYLDGQLTADQFWDKVRGSPLHPETSQPSVGMFEEAFAPLVEQGHHVVCPIITSKHSGTLNSAYVASQSFPGRVTVFDTLSASLGEGYQAIAAAQAAANGHSLKEIIALLESTRARTHLFAALDTIEYVRRGGRVDQLIPSLERVTRVLGIKPLLSMVDGQLGLLGVARSHEKSIQRIQQQVAGHGPAEALIVAHTRLGDEALGFAQALAQHLSFPLNKVMIAEAGPALSSHAGPGGMAAIIVQRASPWLLPDPQLLGVNGYTIIANGCDCLCASVCF